MIKNIRLLNQQIVEHDFDVPEDVVSWMGAVQAQDYTMSKWALGVRTKKPSLAAVQKSLAESKIVRTHILRPTWHYVAAKDIRWMLKLTGHRILAAVDSYNKSRGIPGNLYKCTSLLERMLEGGRNLTRLEIAAQLEKQGIVTDNYLVNNVLIRAELAGIICGGADKGGKHTYVLLDECVKQCAELHKEEALAELATRYFQSHSPAALTDFTWWSGLTATEARDAIGLISSELVADTFGEKEFYIHRSCRNFPVSVDTVHLVPPYDEYLISYKDRTPVLDLEHHPKAFNNYGIFYPVVLVNGKVVGNWKKNKGKKTGPSVDVSFFEKRTKAGQKTLETAIQKYTSFLSS